MNRRPIAILIASALAAVALMFAVVAPTKVDAASKSSKANKKPIRNPKFDPAAEKVELFDASETGQIGIKLVMNDPMNGMVFVENKTDKPLTVKVPEALVGVPVLAQGFGGGFGGGGMGMGGGGMGMGGGGMGGGGQAAGGGMGGGGMGMGGMGMGGGAFSIPAEKVVSVPFKSVCLEHGKQDPNSSMKYKLIPVSEFSTDPVLQQLLANVGTGKVDGKAAQAAAWHITDKMSFKDLAAKMDKPLGGLTEDPYFTEAQLLEARQLLADATLKANEDKTGDEEVKPESKSPRSRRISKK